MKFSGLPAAAAFVAILSVAPAAAKVGGVYPLRSGIYVQKGTECKGAPNAAIRQYDGRGISDPHSHACIARVAVRKGQRYTVTQSCIDAGMGPAPRFSERQIVTVPNATSFTIRTNGPGTSYRYCPAGF